MSPLCLISSVFHIIPFIIVHRSTTPIYISIFGICNLHNIQAEASFRKATGLPSASELAILMAQGVGDKRKRSRVGSGERPQWAVDGSEGAIPTGARRCHRALASEEQQNKWGTMDEDDLQALKGKEL